MLIPQRARDTTIPELIQLLNKYKTLIVMTKYDGVRCIVIDNIVRGKSLIPITNSYIQELYGNNKYEGKDFEIIVTNNGEYNPVTCCNETVSFTNSEYSNVEHKCVLIDDIFIRNKPFEERLELLSQFVNSNKDKFLLPDHIFVSNIEQLLSYEEYILSKDHEAIVIRNPYLAYKEGISSKEGELLRLKRHISEEAIIEEILPSYANNNEVKINLLGHSERSSHLAGKVVKEEVGKLICRTIKDIHDPWSGRLVITKGSICVVAPGTMTKQDRIDIYKNKDKYKGKMIKFKLFTKGTKNKPRFARFEYFVPDFDKPI